MSEKHFDRTIKTNLYGCFRMAKAAVPHMKPGSAIVVTGSSIGDRSEILVQELSA